MSLEKYIYSVMTDQRRGLMASLVSFLLWLLSLGYGLVAGITRRLYDLNILPSYQAPRPVISVGNMTVGGTGKTPLVIAVVQILLMRQFRVAVLTRGYMPDKASGFSDEAIMLQESLPGVPILVGANRRESIEKALKIHAIDVFVCDDAFSHWPLKRNLDILAIDASNPFGNKHLLPRGILREPMTAVQRASIFVLTKCDRSTVAADKKIDQIKIAIKEIKPDAEIFESRHILNGCVDVFERTAFDQVHLKGVRVLAFCAIADPNSFRQSLRDAGFDVVHLFIFMDHHTYTPEDMAVIHRYAMDNQIQILMTTHKDAVKIRRFKESWQGYKLYYLQVELAITHGKNVFIERICSAAGH